ncbi:MAG: helix-turn-helix domain-containing protein [Cohaesibacteraceae bacterium]
MASRALTPLGEKLRSLRAERGITQRDMATALGVSSAYLSSMEYGKRGLPNWGFVQRLVGYFNLIWDDADELERLALLSDPRVIIDTVRLPPEATRLANHMAQRIGQLSPADCIYLENVIDMLIDGTAPALEPQKPSRRENDAD